MNNNTSLELYIVIVNGGLSRKVIKIARSNNITGATVILGKGTVFSTFLDFLGLSDVRKELVLMAADSKTGSDAIEDISNKLQFSKPNHGIAFSIPLTEIIGAKKYLDNNNKTENEERKMNYQLILTIVDRGNAEQVIEAATSVGSQGGTIINARGSGIHETQKIFNIEIEPEKEVVLIIAKEDNVSNITQAIRNELKIDEPGRGIIFVLEINNTFGLYDQSKEK